ncbi:hypothetical protein FUAX_13490 [Fulvitalea axinellae]|uniref:Metal-dependent HD superfamily phosphohydrolase n=1 Tax=Fulvitalea axinellae TaxID=1182444 RepID=A0AAU9CU05_9BACT|nr:hypothetical protein FUAX_13490 [Fulvitalea axinellae]
MEASLREQFEKLFSTFSQDKDLEQSLWNEIETCHSSSRRKYHNLSHLEYMFENLSLVRYGIKDFEMFQFSIFYHDIVYSVIKTDNEERSARLAENRLLSLGISPERATVCATNIRATKSHTFADDHDIDALCDLDLAVLGDKPSVYERYALNIRKEYSLYPDFLYRPARKKVLEHFLGMDAIYKTTLMRDRLEKYARENITREWEDLNTVYA